ncbi:hypothetical protein AB1K62_14355 [Parasphingorhabdus sp. JC815]
MRVKMKNKRFKGEANVLPGDVPAWEAAGWVAAENPTTKPKKDEKK